MTKTKYTPKQSGPGRTETHVANAPAAPMTAEEERVVRMIHGLTEGDEYELSFVRTADAEVNARLKQMEAILLAQLHDKGPMAAEHPRSPREKILDHLKTIDEDD